MSEFKNDLVDLTGKGILVVIGTFVAFFVILMIIL